MSLPKKMTIKESFIPLQLLVAIIPFFTGVFYEWQSALLSVAIMVIVIVELIRNRKIEINSGLPLLFTAILVAAYIFTAVFAVDRGMVWLGVIKYLPLPLFVIAAYGKKDLLRFVPLSGAVITIISAALSWISAFKGHIIVSGRLAGFFEYPNTFAMFLLVCLILVLFKQELKLSDGALALIFLVGIALSGSKTVIILTVITAIVFVIWIKDKRIKLFSLIGFALLSAGTGVYIAAKMNHIPNLSTFYGRLLYFKDALPVIVKHPFGLGYYGYFYSQGSFQTGVYSVLHIHNDFLQIMLDCGWIPAVIAVVMVVKAFIRADFRSKVLLLMMVLHLLFDFDMQFISMSIIFMAVVINSTDSKIKVIKYNKVFAPAVVPASVLAVVSFYFGAASFFNYIKDYSQAVKIYPAYTEAQSVLLMNSSTNEEMDSIADSILKLNPDHALANDAKARIAFSNGDIVGMIGYKDKAIKYNKYELTEYLDYFDMLSYAISLYVNAGDFDSAQICIDRCLKLDEEMKTVKLHTSQLGMMIDDQPDLELPKEYSDYIVLLQNSEFN